ncbi:hypothetical protein ABT352_22690 [Streptosporangium sp. NPDC000563]|uniref:hypothetical protein n=1 Tax=Streptosporangium sp. NPDC000563 TaxID=3154366 RepID=UPI003322A850
MSVEATAPTLVESIHALYAALGAHPLTRENWAFIDYLVRLNAPTTFLSLAHKLIFEGRVVNGLPEALRGVELADDESAFVIRMGADGTAGAFLDLAVKVRAA